MDISSLKEKLNNVKDVVVNSVVATTSFVYNASSVEVLKVKRDNLKAGFEKAKKQNEVYHKLLEERKHLEQIIIYINNERSHYDMKIAEVVFSTENPDGIKHDYEKLCISLGVFSASLQDVYGRMASVTEMNDENLEKERQLFETSLKSINDKLSYSRVERSNARSQLEKIRQNGESENLNMVLEEIRNNDNDYDNDNLTHNDNNMNELKTDQEENKTFTELCKYVTNLTGVGQSDTMETMETIETTKIEQ